MIWKPCCDTEFKVYISDEYSIILWWIKHMQCLVFCLSRKPKAATQAVQKLLLTPGLCWLPVIYMHCTFLKIPSSFKQVMRKKCAFILIALSIRRWDLKTNQTGLHIIWMVMEKTLNQPLPCLPTYKNGCIFISTSCPTFLGWVLWHETASSYRHVG